MAISILQARLRDVEAARHCSRMNRSAGFVKGPEPHNRLILISGHNAWHLPANQAEFFVD
ncbi:hypothetical protein NKG95_18595 [Mesorhizobium sp. M1423]|uniref:hypothetical protein n=1 Tax=Mesorhizobium sp. M1423 TaxID=2957101 RepID=UPI003336C980